MTGGGEGLKARLRAAGRVGVDTSILIYHFEENPALGPMASAVLECLTEGEGFVFSSVSLAEILVKPFQIGGSRKANELEKALAQMPGIELLPMNSEIAREGARLRARHGLKLADALILATSLAARANIFVTNDAEFNATAGKEKIEILFLKDFAEA